MNDQIKHDDSCPLTRESMCICGAEHRLLTRLDRAVELLEEYSRHHVTLNCSACGSGYSSPCAAECPIGKLLADVDKP